MSTRDPSEKTISRRSLLEWLGGATVLTLGSPLIGAACASGPPRLGDGPRPDAPGVAREAGGFPFQPRTGEAPPFPSTSERTVDPQDLASLLASWKLAVDGLVETPRTFSFAELVALPRQSQTTDFHCVEGWSVYDVPWDGVRLSKLFELVTPRAGVTHVVFHTVGDRYNESLPLAVALEPHTLLGYGIAGSTLPLSHGFPARVVVPRLLGYKNAKYVERIELADHAVDGYWVKAGYPYAGEVPAARLRPGKY
jgi:DMSO/TMAO reductase YedYZ molybdopterin-dependent catalytic subunit